MRTCAALLILLLSTTPVALADEEPVKPVDAEEPPPDPKPIGPIAICPEDPEPSPTCK